MATTPASASAAEREEIAFFDLETSAPPRRELLEFGAILICPRSLVEVASYATLVRPSDPAAAVSATTARCNGITRDAVACAPPLLDVADAIYEVLHGRVWAGHNIVWFDSVRIREAFAEIGRAPPEPKGMIDTLSLLTQRFGTRAGDMKMASLANYFGLGRQKHRSLDDCRMNLEVLKYCATVLFLEASPPEALALGNLLHDASPEVPRTGELVSHDEEMKTIMHMHPSSTGYSEFVEPDDVSTECIKISLPLLHQFRPRTLIQHKDIPLQICCSGLKVRFGVRPTFLSNSGRPKLNIVVDIPENLGKVLQFCDDLAQRSSPESHDTSEWRPLIKKYGNVNRPTVRLNIPTVISGDTAIYSTDIQKKERNGTVQELVFSKIDAAELNSLIRGQLVDAFFSLEMYDYQQNAGIRLVANRLVIHSE